MRKVEKAADHVGTLAVGSMWKMTWPAVVLLLNLGLAGCAGGDSEEPGAPAEGAGAAPSEAAGDGAADTGSASDAVPVAVIVVRVDGNMSEAVNGTVEVAVGANVTFDGSTSTGSNLTYAWDFGDGATGAEAVETHAYAETGTFNVSLGVASGNATDEETLVIEAVSAGPVPGDLMWTAHHEFSGTLLVGNPNTATTADVDYRDHIVPILGTSPEGVPVVASAARLVLDGSGPGALILFLYWRDPAGMNLASGTAQTPDQSFSYETSMDPGDYVARARLFAGANANYVVTVDVDYVAL